MLKVKPFKQKPAFCGPASLKMVLNYYGIRKSEKELIKLSGCTSSKGVSTKGLLEAARKIGLKGFVKDFAEISDIRKYIKKKIPVIVDWFSIDDGHYSVVIGIDKKNIYMQDPELGRVRKMDVKTFKKVWFDFPYEFLRSKKDLIIRRMIVIYK